MDILTTLKQWRIEQARREGVELFRILPNKTLEDLAKLQPQTDEEFLTVKGFKEKKLAKYGSQLKELFGSGKKSSEVSQEEVFDKEIINDLSKKTFSVSEYLDHVNSLLYTAESRVQGEISSLDIREKYLFLTIKDASDESTLGCFMWRQDYVLSGVEIEEGMEIIMTGFSEIYKPLGRFSFKAQSIELVGEGALKAAYEKLKTKLEDEGLFDLNRKKLLTRFPQKIGLITSREGAVIHDFLNNIGQHGFQIQFKNSRVEGQLAVRDLITAIRTFRDTDIDALIVIRGGGSLESLQAFNNEALIREIIDLPFPVLAGIGHHEDVSLFALVADAAASTPTAVTQLLNHSWEEAVSDIRLRERDLKDAFEEALESKTQLVSNAEEYVQEFWQNTRQKFERVFGACTEKFQVLRYALQDCQKNIGQKQISLLRSFKKHEGKLQESIKHTEILLKAQDPKRQLHLGYSIVRKNGTILRSVQGVVSGDELSIEVEDGNIQTEVKGLTVQNSK